MTGSGARRKGRPPKSEKGPATTSIAMRVRPEVYEDIRQDAEKYGRSIAAQAERRVAYREPDTSDVGRMVSIAVERIERRLGKTWSEDDAVRRQCRAATELILDVLLGEAANAAELRAIADREAEMLEKFPQKSMRDLVHLFGGAPRQDAKLIKEMLRDLQQGRTEALQALCSISKANQ